MNKKDLILKLLKNKKENRPLAHSVKVFAPTNIALCKYWGKRDRELNLPVTSSLSISLGKKGTTTELTLSEKSADVILLNQQIVDPQSDFYKRLIAILDLIPERKHFEINTQSNIPTAAGLASSASGFAALVIGLNQLFQWQLTPTELSIFARLGSGSACRSIWQGFVEWHAGALG